MKKVFLCSLCHGGVLGGALYVRDSDLAYKTNKLILNKEYRNIVIPFDSIAEISWRRVLFPIATITTTDGKSYKFLLYNKKRFLRWYMEASRLAQRATEGR